MRYVLTGVATVFLLSTALVAQTVVPNRVAPGGRVNIQHECKAPNFPSILLDTTVPVVGQNVTPNWVFVIPPRTAARTYNVKFKCAGEPDRDAGPLEVTAPLPPSVVAVKNVSSNSSAAVPTVALKEVVQLQVENFGLWRDLNPQTKLSLFIAGAELKNVGVSPTSTGKDAAPEILALRVSPEVDGLDANTRKLWVQVLQAGKTADILEISVGPEGQAPFSSTAEIDLKVYDRTQLVFTTAAFLTLVYFIVRLGRRSWMLRDSNGAADPPYSLAKVQMAVWTVTILGGYLYVWLTTGLFAWASPTALILIGISGATGLIAVGMDSSRREDAEAAREALKVEHAALDQTLNAPVTGLKARFAALPPASTLLADLNAEITRAETKLNQLAAQMARPVALPQNSAGWIRDIVSDDKGVSFHRVQMVVWTVVLVMVFANAVRVDVLMPEFDSTLLGLMGISSGAYLGFKFPEKVN